MAYFGYSGMASSQWPFRYPAMEQTGSSGFFWHILYILDTHGVCIVLVHGIFWIFWIFIAYSPYSGYIWHIVYILVLASLGYSGIVYCPSRLSYVYFKYFHM